MVKIYDLTIPIERKIFESHGGDIAQSKADYQYLKENFIRKCDIDAINRLNEHIIEIRQFLIEENIPLTEIEIEECIDYIVSQNHTIILVSENEINECIEYQLTHNITAKSQVISGEKNYKSEVQEFGILATKAALKLIENNIKPTNKLIIELVKREMNISKIQNGTLIQYCSYARKVIKDEKYIDKVISGEISISNACKTSMKESKIE